MDREHGRCRLSCGTFHRWREPEPVNLWYGKWRNVSECFTVFGKSSEYLAGVVARHKIPMFYGKRR